MPADDAILCPVCWVALTPDDLCATDIELGICHAACLEGSPVVDLDTGEPMDGPAHTYRYSDTAPSSRSHLAASVLSRIASTKLTSEISGELVANDIEGTHDAMILEARAAIIAEHAPQQHVGLTISALQRAHIERQEGWCPDQKPDLSFRGNELGGECGEAQNVIKKLERERHGWRGSRDTIEHLGEELADVIHCAVLCAITAGIDIEQAVIAKFNSTSEKNNLSHRITAPAPMQHLRAADLTNEQKEITLLRIIDAMGGRTDSSDYPGNWLEWFCSDEIHNVHDDTFNRCNEKGWLHTTHDSDTDTSTTTLTAAGRAALATTEGSADE